MVTINRIDPSSRGDLQKFRHGDFTLVPEIDVHETGTWKWDRDTLPDEDFLTSLRAAHQVMWTVPW